MRKCCVGNCKSNYDTESEYVSSHKFPSDKDERQRWLDALPNVVTKVTKNTVVCVKHWPLNYQTCMKKGHVRPVFPPSVFSLPKSFSRQTSTIPRNVEARNVDAASRANISEAKNKSADGIELWEELENFCEQLPVDVIKKSDRIILSEVSGDPPRFSFSLTIFKDFTISCYRGSAKVPCNDLINGYSYKIETFSQIHAVLKRLRTSVNVVQEEVKGAALNISDIVDSADMDEDERTKVKFLIEQLLLQSKKLHGERYDTTMMKTAISLYLRNRNCYSALRQYLTLPHPDTVKKYFGELSTPGNFTECENVIKSVFNKLTKTERFCKVLVDEIHIKPAIRYQGNHIIGFSVDDPTKPARTVLAIMIAPSMGKPAFVCRLIPVYSLTHELLFEETNKIIQLIHKHSGYAMLLMSDNLRTNQACFKLYKETFGSENIFSCNHPVSNDEFTMLFLLYDPPHLLKNIRSNWHTEKMQKLRFPSSEQETVIAQWKDLVDIYRAEEHSIVKSTKLDYATLYPTNFEKQKVSLAINVFNEKTVAALRLFGHKETAIFVGEVTTLWNCINVKHSDKGRNLNDPNREPFTSAYDYRFQFMHDMANKFKKMDASTSEYTKRVMCLTADTSNALVITLEGMSALIKLLLTKGFRYVLPGTIQSDRLEGEFGLYRQSSGGCYYISVQQVINSLSLQRLKLFDELEINSKSHIEDDCCSADLNENEIFMLDECFQLVDMLTVEEKSVIYYIAGYVAKKDNLAGSTDDGHFNETPASEFTSLVSRGKLSHPPDELFDLTCALFSYYKHVEKTCIKHLLVGFQQIYEAFHLSFESETRILRRLINCFSKAFSKQQSDKIRAEKGKKDIIKRRRLNYE